MKAFQIKEKTKRAARKMVKTEGRKVEFQRKNQINARKSEAKYPLGERDGPLSAKNSRRQNERVVERASRQAEQSAQKKGVQVAHLKSPESFPFAPPP